MTSSKEPNSLSLLPFLLCFSTTLPGSGEFYILHGPIFAFFLPSLIFFRHPGLLVYPSPSLLARAEEVLASSAPHFSRKARPSPASSPPPPEPRLSESSSSPALFPPLSVICPESRKAYLNLLRAAKGLVVLTCSDPLSLFLQRYYPSVLQEAFRKSLPRQERPARGRERERRGGKEETFSYSENASHGEEETEGNLLPSAVMTAVGEFILHLLPHLDVGGGGVEENRFFSENRQGESFDAVDRQRKKTSQENTSTLLEVRRLPPHEQIFLPSAPLRPPHMSACTSPLSPHPRAM